MRCFSLALLFLGSTITCLGQNEFLVNSSGDSTQRDAHIARDAMGHYAVVWNSVNQVDSISKGDIYLSGTRPRINPLVLKRRLIRQPRGIRFNHLLK